MGLGVKINYCLFWVGRPDPYGLKSMGWHAYSGFFGISMLSGQQHAYPPLADSEPDLRLGYSAQSSRRSGCAYRDDMADRVRASLNPTSLPLRSSQRR